MKGKGKKENLICVRTYVRTTRLPANAITFQHKLSGEENSAFFHNFSRVHTDVRMCCRGISPNLGLFMPCITKSEAVRTNTYSYVRTYTKYIHTHT